MAKIMNNINFDDNVKEITINGDANRVIRFNASDFSILSRFDEAMKHFADIDKELKKLKISKANDWDSIVKMINFADERLKAETDYIFGYPVADAVFGNMSPMAPVKGKTIFENFIESAMQYIADTIKEEKKASNERVTKYTKTSKRYSK